MTSLNSITPDANYKKMDPEVLIELPVPKIISDDCTIIMNGHHNYGMDKEASAHAEAEEEMKPFLSNHVSLNDQTNSSSNLIPLKETFAASSLEEDSDADVEPESSTHLLQGEEQGEESPICMKNKSKLQAIRSPSQKPPNNNPHSHIQHRPLGPPQNTLPDTECRTTTKIWLVPLFWGIVCILTIIAAFCMMIAVYITTDPDCSPPRHWWQRATFYEIFPASFQDTDGDGFGDMKGLTQHLDYLQNLSIDAVRLNSIFSALDYPLEYEHVIDFANIDPHLGRIEDFQEFVRKLHERNIRLILDLNPTVTSDQHTWAAHWLLHRRGPFEHFYFNITDEEGEEPPLEPNPEYSDRSWTSPHRTFGNHLYLNWSNPILQLEMRSILELWLAQGVDGFYIKHLRNLHVNDREHITQVISLWRVILDNHSENSSRKLLMFSHEDVKYLESVMDPLSFTNIPSMVDLVDASLTMWDPNSSDLHVVKEVERIKYFWSQFSFQPTIVWHLASVETMRLANRISPKKSMAAICLLTMLPGSFSIFYGDELGMRDSFDPEIMKVYRGGQLAPMQWTSTPQGNFTSLETTAWLPLHPDYVVNNVETQTTNIKLINNLTELKRKSDIFTKIILKPSFHQMLVFYEAEDDEPPDYYFHQDRCGLVMVKISDDAGILFANFGSEKYKLADSSCKGYAKLTSFTAFNTLEVLIATNSTHVGFLIMYNLVLYPGDAIIGRIVT